MSDYDRTLHQDATIHLDAARQRIRRAIAHLNTHQLDVPPDALATLSDLDAAASVYDTKQQTRIDFTEAREILSVAGTRLQTAGPHDTPIPEAIRIPCRNQLSDALQEATSSPNPDPGVLMHAAATLRTPATPVPRPRRF